MRIIIALVMVLTADVAKADPVSLQCTGITAVAAAPDLGFKAPQVYRGDKLIIVDTSARRVTVNDVQFADDKTHNIVVNVFDDVVILDADEGATKTFMRLDRLTGKVHFVHSSNIPLGTYEFNGGCRLSQKLF